MHCKDCGRKITELHRGERICGRCAIGFDMVNDGEYGVDDIVKDNVGNEYEVQAMGSRGLALTNLKTGKDIEIDFSIAEQIGLEKK